METFYLLGLGVRNVNIGKIHKHLCDSKVECVREKDPEPEREVERDRVLFAEVLKVAPEYWTSVVRAIPSF